MSRLLSFAVLCLAAVVFVDGAVTYGPPICSKNSQTNFLTSRFTLKVTNNEELGLLQGLVLNTNGELFRVDNCTANVSIVVEMGTNTRYYTVESQVDLTNETNTINGCGITKTSQNGKEVYRMILGIREYRDFITANDSNYRWYCIKDEATDLYLSSNVEVVSNLTVDVSVVRPNVTLQVVRQVGGSFTPTTSCIVGESIALQVTYDRPLPHTDFLTPWGVYIYDTKVSQSSTGTPTNVLTLNTGCIASGNILGFTSPFSRLTTSTTAQSVYRATGATCKRFGTTNMMYFTTTADFCSGVYAADPRCTNYCTSQSGRKKREEELDLSPQVLQIELTVIEKEQEDNTFQLLMVALIVVVVFCLGLVVGVGVCMFLRSKKRGRTSSRSRFTNSSKASSNSDLSIPPKY